MQRHAVTFYDAAYHAVALELEGTMVTADAAYVRKAVRSGALVRLGEFDLEPARGRGGSRDPELSS